MSRLQRKLRCLSTSVAIALVLCAAPLAAQNPRTQLTLSGQTITFPAPTAADYINGYVYSATGVSYTLDATSGNQSHTTTVSIRATSAGLGGAKVIGDLEWRRSDLANWNPITLVNAQVEQRVMVRGGLNDPWNNTIFFRIKLSWTSDPPATYTANYQLTLSQTVP
ncbi:MAG TPA: hypothetical protein VJ840_10860 [Gemmatimonadaceae bacterium]|nr:hypothetical protein [Gemmatimonadaceae bacterium]